MTDGTSFLGYWDIVVVGAGSAGCTLASRLTEDPDRRVLLLECGPDFPPPSGWPRVISYGSSLDVGSYLTEYDALYTETGRPAFTVRGKLVGGSSAVNAAWFFRGLPEDYDSWGSPLWSYATVERFFRKLETDLDFPGSPIHGNAGPIPVRRVPENQLLPHQVAFYEAVTGFGFTEKLDLGDPVGEGVGRLPMNKIDERRISAAMAYIDPVRQRPNLTIWGNCAVTKVLVQRARAIGVLAERYGNTIRVEAGDVVLSAGALATPHLLLLSGIGPAASLSRLGIPIVHDLPGVGQNVHDHPMVIIEVSPPEGFQPQQNDPMYQVILVHSCASSSMRNDLHIVPGIGFEDTLTYQAVIQRAISCGELEFVSSDPSVPPRIHYHYLEHETDRARFREAVRLILDLLQHRALREIGKVRLKPEKADLASDASLDRWIGRSLSSAYHTSGTCKMGPAGDPLAVVDDHGRVHGISDLTLADLSVAQDVIRAPTNATAIMIAERIADLFQLKA